MAAVVLTVVLAGCGSIGPSTVRVDRTAYNEAAVATQEQELLLNLVRTRYLRGIAFLQISSISSNVSVTASLGGRLRGNNSITGSFADAGVAYFDNPTIIYQPVAGELFVRQLLTPLSLDSLGLLVDGGFDPSDVLRVFVAQMNGVPNAVSAATSTPDSLPEYEAFQDVIDTFSALIAEGALVVGASRDAESALTLSISPEARRSPKGRAMLDALRLDPSRSSFRMIFSEGRGGNDIIAIKTRSVMGAIQYLSKAVDVPPSNQSLIHRPTVADDRGNPWGPLLGGIFNIRVSSTRPDGVSVRVFYDGYWYFIAEDDIESKETFAMLSTVLRLQAGGGGIDGPVLTLPVSSR